MASRLLAAVTAGLAVRQRLGVGEEFQSRGHGLRSPELVGVQELFPFSLAGGLQLRGCGKPQQQGPGIGRGPVIKRGERRRIILAQRRLQLVDQRRALLDQGDLVPTERAQTGGGLVLRTQRLLSVTVGAQRIGQGPSVVAVSLGPAGHLAFAVARRGPWRHRINRPAALQQLVHRRAAGGFQRNGRAGEGLHFQGELRPTIGGVGEPKLGLHRALAVENQNVVMIAGPVQGGEDTRCVQSVFMMRAARTGSRRSCGEGRRSYLGRSRLVPERATARKRRGEKTAEVVVAKSKPGRQFTDAGSLWRCEGPNEKESETSMRLGGKRPQMTRQLELPLANRGEAPTGKRSEEAPPATRENERSGASGLMEKVCERRLRARGDDRRPAARQL